MLRYILCDENKENNIKYVFFGCIDISFYEDFYVLSNL